MSNLPPGVSDSMIPGNRPEDVLYDRATIAITECAEQFGCCVDGAATNEELEALDAVVDAFVSFVQRFRSDVEPDAQTGTCRHCERSIVQDRDGRWIDPEATGDDSVWRETCDAHDTFTAEHEPTVALDIEGAEKPGDFYPGGGRL